MTKDFLYEDLVVRYKDNFVPVKIPADKISAIKDLAQKIVEAKSQEEHHQIDSNHEYKRFYTGLLGESALEILLDINIIDWECGDSSKYNHPDIKELGIGVKTVERNKFPIIFKNNKYPQIICVVSDKRPDVVFVCGLATVDVLNRFQSDMLVLSPSLRDRSTKTGFYGFCKLKKISNLEELKKILKN